MQANHIYGGGWGDHIGWFAPKQFEDRNLNSDTFTIYGHKTPIPKVGETLLAEMEKSHIKFEIVEIRRCDDPRDMFFGEVKAVEQEIKGEA